MSDEIHVLLEGDPSVSVGVNNLEDFAEQLVVGSESKEEGVISDDGGELLETESESCSVDLVGSLDDDFDEEDFENDGNKFFESGELVLLGLKLEKGVNNVTDFTFVKLEDTLQDSLNFVNLKDQVLVDIVRQEDLSQLVENESNEVVQWSQSFQGQKPLVPFVKFSVFGEYNILTAEIILQEQEVHFVSDPTRLVEVNLAEQKVNDALRSLNVDRFQGVVQSVSEFVLVHFSLVGSLIVALLPVKSLDGHLSEVLFDTEVGEFIVAHFTVRVPVIPEDVLHHVIHFVLIFLQQVFQSVGDLFLIEFFVSVLVVWSQGLDHSLSHLNGKVVV